jgi:hypothetical protein
LGEEEALMEKMYNIYVLVKMPNGTKHGNLMRRQIFLMREGAIGIWGKVQYLYVKGILGSKWNRGKSRKYIRCENEHGKRVNSTEKNIIICISMTVFTSNLSCKFIPLSVVTAYILDA